jgi:hypothetical protein
LTCGASPLRFDHQAPFSPSFAGTNNSPGEPKGSPYCFQGVSSFGMHGAISNDAQVVDEDTGAQAGVADGRQLVSRCVPAVTLHWGWERSALRVNDERKAVPTIDRALVLERHPEQRRRPVDRKY